MEQEMKSETEAELQALSVELVITRKARQKLIAYCQATDLEVSGYMVLEQEGSSIIVKDAYITHQVSTGTSTEIETTEIARLFERLRKEGIIGIPGVRLGHFHTHPTFDVFWSGTDMELRKTLRKGTDFYVSIVLNQKGEVLAALDINGEFPMSISNLPVRIEDENEYTKQCQEEVKNYVKSPRHAFVQQDAYDEDKLRRWWERQQEADEKFYGKGGQSEDAQEDFFINTQRTGRRIGPDGVVYTEADNEGN